MKNGPCLEAHLSLAECLHIYRSNHNISTSQKVLQTKVTMDLQKRWEFLLVEESSVLVDGLVRSSVGKKCTPEEGIISSTQLSTGKRAVHMWPASCRYKYNNLLLQISVLCEQFFYQKICFQIASIYFLLYSWVFILFVCFTCSL